MLQKTKLLEKSIRQTQDPLIRSQFQRTPANEGILKKFDEVNFSFNVELGSKVVSFEGLVPSQSTQLEAIKTIAEQSNGCLEVTTSNSELVEGSGVKREYITKITIRDENGRLIGELKQDNEGGLQLYKDGGLGATSLRNGNDIQIVFLGLDQMKVDDNSQHNYILQYDPIKFDVEFSPSSTEKILKDQGKLNVFHSSLTISEEELNKIGDKIFRDEDYFTLTSDIIAMNNLLRGKSNESDPFSNLFSINPYLYNLTTYTDSDNRCSNRYEWSNLGTRQYDVIATQIREYDVIIQNLQKNNYFGNNTDYDSDEDKFKFKNNRINKFNKWMMRRLFENVSISDSCNVQSKSGEKSIQKNRKNDPDCTNNEEAKKIKQKNFSLNKEHTNKNRKKEQKDGNDRSGKTGVFRTDSKYRKKSRNLSDKEKQRKEFGTKNKEKKKIDERMKPEIKNRKQKGKQNLENNQKSEIRKPKSLSKSGLKGPSASQAKKPRKVFEPLAYGFHKIPIQNKVGKKKPKTEKSKQETVRVRRSSRAELQARENISKRKNKNISELKIARNIFLTAEGLAVFRDIKLGVASDLHIGTEESFGEPLARVQTNILLKKFLQVIERFGLKEMLLNGDIKHTFGKECGQEWREIKFLTSELLKKVQVKIVSGNHDFYIKTIIRDLHVSISQQFEINNILFVHGDKEIHKQEKKLIVIGNEHPSIKLRDELGANRKYPCFLYAKKEKILVLPAMNPWTFGTDILKTQKEKFLSPILNTINLEEAQVYITDGEQIYDFKKLKDVRKMLKRF